MCLVFVIYQMSHVLRAWTDPHKGTEVPTPSAGPVTANRPIWEATTRHLDSFPGTSVWSGQPCVMQHNTGSRCFDMFDILQGCDTDNLADTLVENLPNSHFINIMLTSSPSDIQFKIPVYFPLNHHRKMVLRLPATPLSVSPYTSYKSRNSVSTISPLDFQICMLVYYSLPYHDKSAPKQQSVIIITCSICQGVSFPEFEITVRLRYMCITTHYASCCMFSCSECCTYHKSNKSPVDIMLNMVSTFYTFQLVQTTLTGRRAPLNTTSYGPLAAKTWTMVSATSKPFSMTYRPGKVRYLGVQPSCRRGQVP